MRTISGTLSTREEAEAARRRLEALGIDGDRIGFNEVSEPGAGGEPGIFVTVKVAPEQVAAASDILKGGGMQAAEPFSTAADESPIAPRPAVSRPPEERRMPAQASPPRSVAEADRQPERVERRPAESHSPSRPVPSKDRQPGTVRLARMAAIAALLAGLGFALGAALGILF